MEHRFEEMDDLFSVVEYRTIDGPMSLKDGMHVLLGRLGMSCGKARKAVRDRYPSVAPKEERRSMGDFRVKCFVRSDILFTDVLHAGYDELRHLGIGRRYLVNKVLRAVVSGTCDAYDCTGQSGDFPPRSWLTQDAASSAMDVQSRAIMEVKVDGAKLLKSVKVRMQRASTDVLKCLSERCAEIRKGVREAVIKGEMTGLEYLSGVLDGFKDEYTYRIRVFDIKNRRKRAKMRRRIRPDKYETKKRPFERNTKSRQKSHIAFGLFLRGITDLRKLLDPSVPNWYRRPTDEDWTEGSRPGFSRKPVCMNRRALFRRNGLGDIPGITISIGAEDWSSARTDWTVDEARSRASS